MVQLFSQAIAQPNSAGQARRAEERGWHGLSFVDSQNLSGDVYVAMTTAATATERLIVATGVTNPVTRHPAVTAGAVASVQALSAGRAVLALGRGDSALAHLGRAPARVADLGRYLVAVQSYLRGDALPFSDLGFGETVAPPIDQLELAATAGASAIAWLPSRHAKVPVEVAATGPRVISVAARHADRVLFALGADPARVQWGIAVARAARLEAGLDPAGVRFGAFVNVVCLPDVGVARDLARGGLSTIARFAVMHGDVVGPVSAEHAAVMHRLHDDYDMRSHTRTGSAQAALLTDDFVDSYAIVGPPERCLDRLRALIDLGLDKLIVVGPSMGADRDSAGAATEMFAREILGNLDR
jgi:5,10-methylenetetrahydromethanopterin reductase